MCIFADVKQHKSLVYKFILKYEENHISNCLRHLPVFLQ